MRHGLGGKVTMGERTYGRTGGGVPITEEFVAKLAGKAEAGFSVDQILARRGGGTAIGGSTAANGESVPVNPDSGGASPNEQRGTTKPPHR
jgi:hypothetical protein